MIHIGLLNIEKYVSKHIEDKRYVIFSCQHVGHTSPLFPMQLSSVL